MQNAEPDPDLLEAMRDRVVRRKPAPYGTRKAGPGRPKGCTKSPRSGKRAGTPNLMSPEFRQWLAEKAKPFELLASICNGEEIDEGDGKRRKPTLGERMRAAETILSRTMPALAATQISGPGGGALQVEDAPAMSKLEVARRIAFLLTEPLADEGARVLTLVADNTEKSEASAPASDPIAAEEPETSLSVGNVEPLDDGCTLRLEERLPGGRLR